LAESASVKTLLRQSVVIMTVGHAHEYNGQFKSYEV
jgi:hypothetical protein